MKRLRRRPSPALVISVLALFAAIGGSAWAVNKVTSKEIKKNAVRAKHIKQNAVRTAELQDGGVLNADLGADSVDGSKVAPNSLNDSDISDYEVLGNSYVRVEATEAATAVAAQDAAPETDLFSKGQLSIYAKCYLDTTVDEIHGEIYARTSANGSILDGQDNLPGGPAAADFLNTGTDEIDAQLDTEDITDQDASFNENEFALAAPDGTGLVGQTAIGVKNGSLPEGNGIYGAGNVCLFGGEVAG